jgi:hypothetical protein
VGSKSQYSIDVGIGDLLVEWILNQGMCRMYRATRMAIGDSKRRAMDPIPAVLKS